MIAQLPLNKGIEQLLVGGVVPNASAIPYSRVGLSRGMVLVPMLDLVADLRGVGGQQQQPALKPSRPWASADRNGLRTGLCYSP